MNKTDVSDISIVLPCFNEEDTVAQCVKEAKSYIYRRKLRGEVIVVDNGSTDASAAIAKECGARVITENRRGYGWALRTGFAAACGKVVIMGDSDATYDLADLDKFYVPIIAGKVDLVMGNRFWGGIKSHGMPLLHRIGVPFLTVVANLAFGVRIGDFHCGIRSISLEALKRLEFHTTGMEFATEMIAEAAKANLRIYEVPAVLRSPPKGHISKVRTFRDGFRHLNYIVKGGKRV